MPNPVKDGATGGRCIDCDGKGIIRTGWKNETIPCERCEGTGQWPPPQPERDLPPLSEICLVPCGFCYEGRQTVPIEFPGGKLKYLCHKCRRDLALNGKTPELRAAANKITPPCRTCGSTERKRRRNITPSRPNAPTVLCGDSWHDHC